MDSVYLGEEGLSTTYSCERQGTPDLRLLHYNDVYHVESGSAEPIGGPTRFQTIVNQYRHAPKYADEPELLTFFSGDAFNPSLESTVTKGRHMIPFLNNAGTDVACVGNHDLDFGIAQFRHLRSQCKFPWLLANVLDPALGENVALANCEKTCMLTSSNGIKVGVIGLGEREWLDTINALPPDIIYKSASETAKELVPALREQGAEMVVAVTHQREPNDNKLAEKLPAGLVDIVLGGHDHYYSHSVINSTHVLRSGTDYRQLSYLQAWRKEDGSAGWDFSITRRDIVRSIPEDPATVALVSKVTSTLKSRLEKPIGYTAAPLDARFTTVRTRESNIGNFVCDLMRYYYGTDCAIMAAGTIRGDQIYTPGVLRLKDIMNCFPFEDPVVVLRITGQAIIDALENGVSTVPALEGRFPQVSNISFAFSGSTDPGSRVLWAKINDETIEPERKYTLATRGYMARAKDGFTSLLIEAEGGEAEEIVSEENGVLISTILRQYFLNLKVVGKWHRWSTSLNRHWGAVHEKMQRRSCSKTSATSPPERPPNRPQRSWNGSLKFHQYTGYKPEQANNNAAGSSQTSQSDEVVDSDSDSEPEILSVASHFVSKPPMSPEAEERQIYVARLVLKKWMRLAGISNAGTIADVSEEFTPSWTQGIAPRLEGRIQQVDGKVSSEVYHYA